MALRSIQPDKKILAGFRMCVNCQVDYKWQKYKGLNNEDKAFEEQSWRILLYPRYQEHNVSCRY